MFGSLKIFGNNGKLQKFDECLISFLILFHKNFDSFVSLPSLLFCRFLYDSRFARNLKYPKSEQSIKNNAIPSMSQ